MSIYMSCDRGRCASPGKTQSGGMLRRAIFIAPWGAPSRGITDKKFMFQKSKPQPINKQWIFEK